MILIDKAPLYQEIESLPDTMSVCSSMEYCKGMRCMKEWVLDKIESAQTVDAISIREWNLLWNSIQELQENNPEKKDIQLVTKFLLRLMDISERRNKCE